LQFEFVVFMVEASKTLPIPELTPASVTDVEKDIDKHEDLIKKATSLLKLNIDSGPMSPTFSGGLRTSIVAKTLASASASSSSPPNTATQSPIAQEHAARMAGAVVGSPQSPLTYSPSSTLPALT
jgi:hypothetical protein